jgi:hypothetical protein
LTPTISKASAPTGWFFGNGRLRETRSAVIVWPRSGSLMTALMVRVENLAGGVLVGDAVVVVVSDVVVVVLVAGVVPAGAVGSAVTGASALHAASATTGATRPTTARCRRRAPVAVDGRAEAGAEVVISGPA